jgi:hypothetical protein
LLKTVEVVEEKRGKASHGLDPPVQEQLGGDDKEEE